MLTKKEIYENLAESYEKMGKSSKALDYYKLFTQTKDSLMNSEKFKLISEMESKYENEKHQLKIEKLEKEQQLQTSEIEKQNEKVKRQNTIIISFVFGFILIIIFLIIIYRFFTAKKIAYNLLSIQNVEIQHKNEEIITQRDIVVKQKNYIEEIHKEVTDSINYAKNLQSAILPESDFIKELLHEYFIIFKPRNIVSGDFYWISKRRNWTLIAVADCTGHGVPGAFMSMLGISYLNEIVAKDEVQTASQVLNYLRLNIIKSLKQKGKTGEQKDGMDIAFVALNMETLELQFAGANNPLYIVTQSSELLSYELEVRDTDFQNFQNFKNLEEHTNQRFVLQEVKPDKMPIAIHVRMDDFKNNEIKLNKSDLVYLFSDGYADQFGGPKGKKFLYRQFKELLIANWNKSMTEQKEILDNKIEDWISGNEIKYEQTDDITVLGLRI
ncbi:MAG: hypothetical protein A2033_18970 [Bacteroidetes bacterium GWA2_31_9]|nr:MAG: hypothetical protein A2033_18970 [Bacteroidetes bacterium GWA2_31_9]